MGVYVLLTGGLDTGWTMYAPFSTRFSTTRVVPAALAIFVTGFSSILTGLNFIVTIHKMRAPGMALVQHAALSLVDLRHQPHQHSRHARHRHHGIARGGRTALPLWILRSGARRRPRAVPAPVLVLLAPGGVHHDSAGDGRHQRAGGGVLPQAGVRLQLRRVLEPRHRRARVPRLGPPHVRGGPVGVRVAHLLHAQLSRRHPVGHQGLQLDGDDVQGLGVVADADALCDRLHRAVYDRRADRSLSRVDRRQRARDRHLLHHRALPLHHGGRHDHGLSRRPPLLVARRSAAGSIRKGCRSCRRRLSSSAST